MNDAIAGDDIWNGNIGAVNLHPSFGDIHSHGIAIESFDIGTGEGRAGSICRNNVILENFSESVYVFGQEQRLNGSHRQSVEGFICWG